MKYFNIGIIIIILTVYKCEAQHNKSEVRSNYGFQLTGLSKGFVFNNHDLTTKNNSGFGIGLFFLTKLERSVNLDVEVQLNQEYHTFVYNTLESDIKEKNLIIPVQVQYFFTSSSLYLSGDLAYKRQLSSSNKEIQFNRNIVSSSIGLNYIISFKNFKLIPLIQYSLGLNNSIENFKLFNYTGNVFARNTGFSFTIKVM